jgi:hypothetical protein
LDLLGLGSPPRRRVFHHLRVNFAGWKRDKGREGRGATLARGLAVNFIACAMFVMGKAV